MNARLPVLTAALALGLFAPAAADSTPSPAPSASAAASPAELPEDKAVTARARAEFIAWQSGTIDRTHYTKPAADAFSDAVIAQVSPQIKALGALTTMTFVSAHPYQGDVIYRYTLACANGNALYTYVINGDGKIDGIFFKPLQ